VLEKQYAGIHKKKQGHMRPALTINTVKSYLPPERDAGYRPAEADFIDG
jgi:hypothetical protein